MTKPVKRRGRKEGRRRFWYASRIYYLLLCVAALTFSMMEGGPVTNGLLYAALLLLPASALYAGVLRRLLTVRHGMSKMVCMRAEPIQYTCLCANRGVLPAGWACLRVMASRSLLAAPAVRVFGCAPYEKNEWHINMLPVHRGQYIISVEDAVCGDLFNLFRMKLKTPPALEIMVLPRLIPLSEEWRRRMEPVLTGEQHVLTTDEPAVESRGYRYGDAMRRIHWNLTARSREIMVREYERQTERRMLCVLDTSPFEAERPLDCEDALIEACLSVVHFALENRFETMLVYGAGGELRRMQGNSLRFFDSIHMAMAAVDFSADMPAEGLLAQAGKAYCLALFTAKPPSEEFFSVLPADRPVEIFLMRTGRETPVLPNPGLFRVTLLDA